MAYLLGAEMDWNCIGIGKIFYSVVLIIGTTMLFSCATVSKFEKRMDAKKGLTKEQLIDEMGIPDREYKTDSFMIIEYNQHDTINLPTSSTSYVAGNKIHTTTSNPLEVSCKLEFKLIDGVVKNYRYKGALCRSY